VVLCTPAVRVVAAHEGMAFSGPQEFHINIPANRAPTVTATDQTAPSGQVMSASSLFQASDADGDGLTYFFYDNSADPTSGHFTVNGVVQAAGTTFAVSAAQLAQTTFTSAPLAPRICSSMSGMVWPSADRRNS